MELSGGLSQTLGLVWDYIERIKNSQSERFRAQMAGRLFDHLERHSDLIQQYEGLWKAAQDKLFDLTVNQEWGEGYLYWDAFGIDEEYLVNVIRGLQSQLKNPECGC
jgi:hypothetical protein